MRSASPVSARHRPGSSRSPVSSRPWTIGSPIRRHGQSCPSSSRTVAGTRSWRCSSRGRRTAFYRLAASPSTTTSPTPDTTSTQRTSPQRSSGSLRQSPATHGRPAPGKGGDCLRKVQSQGVHHITLVGADRQTSIDFWEGMLGMPFVFEQPNLDRAEESHLYLDPGDGRLITIFTNEQRTPDPSHTSTDRGAVHHIAFSLSQATFAQTIERIDERGITHSGVKDRGFMDSIYFHDPLGLLIELASYRFEPPAGLTHADVLLEAHKIRVERGGYNIDRVHLADAIETLVTRSRATLSDDRSPKDPYG